MCAQWRTIAVYYYDANKDDLLLDCIRPLLTTIRENGWAERVYFVRHWRGGSHIRLQIDAQPAVFGEKIEPYIRKEVEHYLQHAPSMAAFTEEEAHHQHKRRNMHLASSAYSSLRPNNSLEVMPYEDLASIIGSEDAARLLEDYYESTNELAFTLMAQTRNNYTARLNACFDQLVALVATFPFLPLERAYMSYRSHAEGYIVGEPLLEAPQVRRQRLEKMYQERQDVIKHRVQKNLVLIVKAPERLPAWLSTMIEIHQRYVHQAFQQVQNGDLRLKTHADAADDRAKMQLNESPYLSAAFNDPGIVENFQNPIVIAHRVGLNFLYSHLHRIGMLNEDRYILDYYIANAIEAAFNIDPLALIHAASSKNVQDAHM
jgi:Lantibiotic biosynthesis dehydratase C-term